MNLKNVIAMTNDATTTVGVVFDTNSKVYVYRVPKSMNAVVGDKAVVPNSNGVKLTTVVEVHDESDIDLDYGGEYKWVIALVDTGVIDEIRQQEAKALKELKRQRRVQIRKQALESLGVTNMQVLLTTNDGAKQ